jgi:nitronate monooxygenase
MLGADFVVCGTRFIATHESMASQDYREMVVASTVEDLVPSKAVSGVMANWLKPTLEKAGLNDNQLREEKRIDFSGDIIDAPKAWKDVWSAGQGLGVVDCIAHVEEVVSQMEAEYLACLREEQQEVAARLQAHEPQYSAHQLSK